MLMKYRLVIVAFAPLVFGGAPDELEVIFELVRDSRAPEVHLGNIGGVKQW